MLTSASQRVSRLGSIRHLSIRLETAFRYRGRWAARSDGIETRKSLGTRRASCSEISAWVDAIALTPPNFFIMVECSSSTRPSQRSISWPISSTRLRPCAIQTSHCASSAGRPCARNTCISVRSRSCPNSRSWPPKGVYCRPISRRAFNSFSKDFNGSLTATAIRSSQNSRVSAPRDC